MKSISKLIIPLILLLLVAVSCSPELEMEPDDVGQSGLPDVGSDSESIPQWIYDEMSFFYYWNDGLPTSDPDGDEDPEAYFQGLLSIEDNFSYISDDAESLKEEITGTVIAMGFSPAFGVFTNSNNLFAIVEYVYPGSPAEKAGLKRGDIILEINEKSLSESNYRDLLSVSGFSVTLGELTNRGIIQTDEVIEISTGIIELDPVIHYEVKNVDNVKTGYLVFVDFIAGENDKWLNSLGSALGEMKNQGISQLILDLRYNPGGEVRVANYLASALAPISVVNDEEILVSYQYNENLQKYFTDRQGPDSPNIISRFRSNENNLNLNEVIFLTSGTTASASELVINGLKPYMDVTVIGENTFGKFYGSYLLYDQDDPPKHNWAIAPVVLKYANANGVTDFANGITPDIYLQDDLLNATEFGNESDPMLAAAIAYIKGDLSSARVAGTRAYEPVYDLERINRKNIFNSVNVFMN